MTPVATPAAPDPLDQAPPDRHAEAHRTLRNAGVVMASRVLHVAGATLFAILVPRLLGPARFGSFTLLTTVSSWFAQVSGVGVGSLVTRRIPEYLAAGHRAASDKLITNLLVLRTGSGVLAALAYLVIVAAVLGEPDLLAAMLIAAALPLRILSHLCLGILLGKNQIVRWNAGELLMRWLTLAGVAGGALTGGLPGACAGFLLSSVVILAVCVGWTWESVRWSSIDLTKRYLTPHLRTGTAFAAGNLLSLLASRSGPVILRLATGSYVQVGYFGAAFAIYMTGAQAVMQLAMAFVPFLITRFQHGERRQVGGWIERLLAMLVISTVLVNFAVAFVAADLVPLVLGAAYAPVVTSLVPMSMALTVLSFAGLGRIVVLVVDRPRTSAVAGGVHLAVSWIAGYALAVPWGAPGAAAGFLMATAAWGAAMLWPLRHELPYSVRPAINAIALGLAFTPLLLLRGGWAANALLLAGSSAAYLLLVARLHIVSPKDLQTLKQLLRRRRAVSDPVMPLSEDA